MRAAPRFLPARYSRAGTALLEVSGVDVHHGHVQALHGVGLRLPAGEILALAGTAGAGKSTLLGAVAGLWPVGRGSVVFAGRDVTALPAHRRVALGIALTPEGGRIFPALTVEENLLVGAYLARPGLWGLAAVYALFPVLGELRGRPGRRLSGGERQALAIGRALMSNPRLLLLDEVSLGLTPQETRPLYGALSRITAQGTAVLLAERDAGLVLRVADRVQCLLEGRTVLEADAAGLTRDQLARACFALRGDT